MFKAAKALWPIPFHVPFEKNIVMTNIMYKDIVLCVVTLREMHSFDTDIYIIQKKMISMNTKVPKDGIFWLNGKMEVNPGSLLRI